MEKASVWRKEKVVITNLLSASRQKLDIPYWWLVDVGFVSELDIKVSFYGDVSNCVGMQRART